MSTAVIHALPLPRPPEVEAATGPEIIADRYVVAGTIATGGMGEVLLARDPVLGRRVAIKRCRPWLPARAQARLRTEARLGARLNHRAVAQIYDLVTTPTGDALVMEHVLGPSLQTLHGLGIVRRGGALRIALEIASGLSCIHDHQIVHLDLKLENVLVAADGQPKIIDFGIARCASDPIDDVDPEITGEHAIEGTPRVMSPEQIDGRDVDARSDLFSFGVLLYELLSGTTPFGTTCQTQTLTRVLTLRPPSLRDLDPRIDDPLSDLVDQLLEKEPGLRPQSAAEVLIRLRDLAEH